MWANDGLFFRAGTTLVVVYFGCISNGLRYPHGAFATFKHKNNSARYPTLVPLT
jgi:hypothetical protein